MPDNPLSPLGMGVEDLPPSEARAIDFDWAGLGVSLIRSADDPHFEEAYATLWNEFGAKNQLESRATLAHRFCWRPEKPIAGYAMFYEMIVVNGPDGVAAVHDHTATFKLDSNDDLIVHLSHIYVAPKYRGSGLAGWMRAIPLHAARECLHRIGQLRAITLVAEMEAPTATDPSTIKRLRSYERAGYLKIDPTKVDYQQPDFRDPAIIDTAAGPSPVPLSLVIRRIGRENERAIIGRDITAIARGLYHVYRQHIRPRDMHAMDEVLKHLPSNHEHVALLPPTQRTTPSAGTAGPGPG